MGHLRSTDDANGNTLSDPSGKSYSWDFENRLVQAVVPGTNGGTTTFRYDPFGRRIQKSGPLGTTNYLYDGFNLLEEADQSGSVLARYTQDDGIDNFLAMLRSGTTTYFHADALGSVTSLSNTAGSLAKTYTYDSFGKLTASTGTLTNPVQYTAREFDSETGLNYYRTRYYDPNTGRFLSEDPVSFDSGINFYRYVTNSPVNATDPSGEGSEAVLPWVVPNLEIPVWGQVVGAGAAGWMIGRGIGHIPIGDGQTVDDAVTDAMASAITWSRSRGNSDPIPYPGTSNPGREPCDKGKGPCKPCPPDTPAWSQPGNQHGGTTGVHYHWYHWNQNPETCECFPVRMSGGTPP